MVLTYHTVWYCYRMEDDMSRTKKMKTLWLAEGLKILATKGPGALSIESLTHATGKTKGSFYHHFMSRENYVKQLLEYYEKTNIDEINEVVDQENNPRAQLKKLSKLVFQISSVCVVRRRNVLGEIQFTDDGIVE